MGMGRRELAPRGLHRMGRSISLLEENWEGRGLGRLAGICSQGAGSRGCGCRRLGRCGRGQQGQLASSCGQAGEVVGAPGPPDRNDCPAI